MPGHVFISYSHKDSEYSLRLAEALEKKGFSVWIDERIDYGTRWPRVIQKQIDDCSAFVVIMTPRSYDSDWVQNELSYAMGEGKPIFPLLLEGKAWLSVAAVHYVDVSSGLMPSLDFYRRLGGVVTHRTLQEVELEKPLTTPKPELIVSRPYIFSITEPIKIELIRITTGEFLMGSDPTKDEDAKSEEQPQHRVSVSEFYIGKYPVTNVQYSAFVKETSSKPPVHWKWGTIPSGKKDHPVVNVTWSDAVAFCKWLGGVIGREFRLPTESEWEYAARGGSTIQGYKYAGSDNIDDVAWYDKNSGRDTHPVGQKNPTEIGLFDMSGNVWEWCADWYDKGEYERREGKMVKDPQGPEKGEFRVLRGGAFHYYRFGARCAYRSCDDPGVRRINIGFRVVVSPT